MILTYNLYIRSLSKLSTFDDYRKIKQLISSNDLDFVSNRIYQNWKSKIPEKYNYYLECTNAELLLSSFLKDKGPDYFLYKAQCVTQRCCDSDLFDLYHNLNPLHKRKKCHHIFYNCASKQDYFDTVINKHHGKIIVSCENFHYTFALHISDIAIDKRYSTNLHIFDEVCLDI